MSRTATPEAHDKDDARMNTRHSKKGRKAVAALTLTAGLVLAVGGCGSSDGGDEGEGKANPSSATGGPSTGKPEPESSSTGVTETTVEGNGISLTVASAVRDDGGFLTLSGQVTNNTSGRWVAAEWLSDEKELEQNAGSMAGASLVDSGGKKKYLVLRDTQGRCLCTKFTGGIGQGDSSDWFAQFPAPPAGTQEVQLQLPTMPPATVKISEGE